MYGFYCITYIEYMLGKTLLDYTNLISTNDYKKNGKTKQNLLMTKLACFSFDSYWLCFNFCFCFIILCSCCHCKFAVEIKICAITLGIKKYNSILKKKGKKHDKVRLFGNDKVNTIKF